MSSYFLNVTNEDRENILDKHRTLYDGYAVRHNNEPSKEQPLYVQDFANDKQGITVNSKGEVSTYNNKIYMKESKNICSECGLYENVCECGKGYMEEEMEEGIYDVEDINNDNKFDYVEEDGELGEKWSEKYKRSIDCNNPKGFSQKAHCQGRKKDSNESSELDEVKPHELVKGKKYRYKTPSHQADIEFSDEHEYPEGGENMYGFKNDKTGYALGKKSVEDFLTDIDDDLKESFVEQKNKINEMFNRFKNYN